MATFNSVDTCLHYEDIGNGVPLILLHGFGLSARTCWDENGWHNAFSNRGFRPIALDSRGHGLSEKLYDASKYGAAEMTSDVLRLMDHLGVQKAHIIGHSMGARTAFSLALTASDRVKSIVAISIGSNLFQQVQSTLLIKALGSDSHSDVPPHLLSMAEHLLEMGNDARALISCVAAPRSIPREEQMAGLRIPVLTICGADDPIIGDPMMLQSIIPKSESVVVASQNHESVLASSEGKTVALRFVEDHEKREA